MKRSHYTHAIPAVAVVAAVLSMTGCKGRHFGVSKTCAAHNGVKDIRDVTPAGGGWGTAIICRDGYATISLGGVKP